MTAEIARKRGLLRVGCTFSWRRGKKAYSEYREFFMMFLLM